MLMEVSMADFYLIAVIVIPLVPQKKEYDSTNTFYIPIFKYVVTLNKLSFIFLFVESTKYLFIFKYFFPL